MPASDGLPAYTLRLSNRARHVRLSVTPHEGVVVVVPEAMRDFDPAPVLRERAQWIAEATEHFAEHRARLTQPAEEKLPEVVEFALTGERWVVRYEPAAATRVSVREREGVLAVIGPPDDAEAVIAALQLWLHRAAKERLIPMLSEVAAEAGVSYAGCTVRAQRARWGGCSAKGSISMNRGLVFLPADLVRAIMLHELAHVREPNHSPRFWAWLGELDPHAQEHRPAIAEARDALPAWAEPG